jgi:hypothetical protein
MGSDPQHAQGRCSWWRIWGRWRGTDGVLMPLRSFVRKLLGGESRPSELEKIVLSSVRDKLNGDIATRWDKQVQAINKIQRLPEGVEVNFYRMKNSRPSFDPELAFPNKTEELLVARVEVGLPDSPSKLTASIWCVKGFLFSIEYDGSVLYFEEAAGMDPTPEFIVNCKITADLRKTE